jgi:hypothetical protein
MDSNSDSYHTRSKWECKKKKKLDPFQDPYVDSFMHIWIKILDFKYPFRPLKCRHSVLFLFRFSKLLMLFSQVRETFSHLRSINQIWPKKRIFTQSNTHNFSLTKPLDVAGGSGRVRICFRVRWVGSVWLFRRNQVGRD